MAESYLPVPGTQPGDHRARRQSTASRRDCNDQPGTAGQRHQHPAARHWPCRATTTTQQRPPSSGADCIGIIVASWSTTKVVLKFGNSYGSFAHWSLTNGDGYALSIKTALRGGAVSGLS